MKVWVSEGEADTEIGNEKYTELRCFKCKQTFMVLTEYEGVITCPYCGVLVEG